MAKIGRPGLSEIERRRVWELWKQGGSFTEISETVGVAPGSVFSILRPRGGIYFPRPQPGAHALSLVEREEISRGLAAEQSIRTIATQLDRAPSTISREIHKTRARRSIGPLMPTTTRPVLEPDHNGSNSRRIWC